MFLDVAPARCSTCFHFLGYCNCPAEETEEALSRNTALREPEQDQVDWIQWVRSRLGVLTSDTADKSPSAPQSIAEAHPPSASEPHVSWDGELLGGRYEPATRLGHGAMGEVWEAFDGSLNRPVAVKFMKMHLSESSDHAHLRERFLQEARIQAKLKHHNIVDVYDYGFYRGRPFIIMELLRDGTLKERIASKRGESQEAALVIARDVLCGLHAAHTSSEPILHRDIKPENILVGHQGQFQLGDFGVATLVALQGELTAAGQPLGTTRYMAPERLKGAKATPQTDLFAVGICLYEILTGCYPFPAATEDARQQAVHEGQYTPLSVQRPDLRYSLVANIVQSCLHPSVTLRFQTAEQVLSAIGTHR